MPEHFPLLVAMSRDFNAPKFHSYFYPKGRIDAKWARLTKWVGLTPGVKLTKNVQDSQKRCKIEKRQH